MTFLLGAALASAHDAGLSTAQVRCAGEALEITTGFSLADAQMLLPAADRGVKKWSEREFAARKAALTLMAGGLWDVQAGETASSATRVDVELIAGDSVSFRVSYTAPAGARVRLRARVFEKLPAGHREFVTVEDASGGVIARKLLSAQSGAVEFHLTGAERATSGAAEPIGARAAVSGEATFGSFVKLGVAHIWTGYDHLLFLFGLLVVCRSFRGIVVIVSCFTLAHSITLALATAGWIEIPGRFVEPAIAASIVFVGAENLLRRGAEPRGRWAVTFGFGLVHGLGFASVLRDLGVGEDGRGLAMPVLSFNLGVELGQVVVAAIVLPLLWRWRRKDWFATWGVMSGSILVVALGLWWFVERVTA